MKKKMIYSKTLQSVLDNEISDESICFIEETKQIYTHGNYFGYTEEELDSIIKNSSSYSELITKLDAAKSSTILVLRSYLFNVSGTFTKTELESTLGQSLDVIVSSMKLGNPITIFSSDDVSCNISFVVESNCTLTDEGELESLTLFWHQYQLWNTVSITLNSDGTYTMGNTTTASEE